MPSRTVVVRLIAQTGQYQSALGMASRTARQLATQANAAGIAASAGIGSIGASARKSSGQAAQSFRFLRNHLVGLGIPLVAGAIVKSFVDFERQMAHTAAVGDPFGATTSGMRKMRTAALEAGTQYGFTAKEVGEAEEELAKAGLHTAQILGGVLNSTLTLAAAGTVSLADAAKYVSVTMTQFELKASDSAHIADELSRAANATVSGVDQMATSLSYVGPQAHAAGVSLDDTVTTISLFNQAGLDADMAGTNLRGMLVSLSSPSHLASQEMHALGIELYDSEGKFKGIGNMADQLQTKFGGLTQAERDMAMGRIFSNHQLQGAMILMRAGARGVEAMKTVIESQSSAEDVARAKMASFAGEVAKAGTAVQSGLIESLENVGPQLTWLVHGFERGGKAIGNMSGGAQLATVAIIAQAFAARRLRANMGGLADTTTMAYRANTELIRSQRTLAALVQRRQAGPAQVSPALHARLTKDINDQARAIRQLHEVTGEMSGFSGWAGRTAATIGTATGAWGKFSAAGMGALRGVRLAAGSMLSVLGGVPGAILTGAIIGFAAYSQSVEEQKRKADDLVDSLDSLGQAYAMTGDVNSKDVRELVRKDSLLKDVAANTEAYGVSIDRVARATAGDVSSQRAVIDALKDRKQALHDSFAAEQMVANRLRAKVEGYGPSQADKGAYEASKRRLQVYSDQAAAIARLLPGLQREFEENRKLNEAYAELRRLGIASVLDEIGLSADKASKLERDLASNANVLASEQAEAADQTKALESSLGLLQGQLNSTSDAMSAFRGKSLRDAFFEEEHTAAKKGRLVGDDEGPTLLDRRSAAMATKRAILDLADAEQHLRDMRKKHEKVTAGDRLDVEAAKLAVDEAKARERDLGKKPGKHREGAEAERTTYKPLWSPKLLDTVTGKIRTTTEAGQKMNDMMSGKTADILKVVQAAWAQAKEAGASPAEAADYAASKFAQLREELVLGLKPIVGSRKEAEKLVNTYLALPKDIRTTFGVGGLDLAIQAWQELHVTMEQIPNSTQVAVVTDSPATAQKLRDLHREVVELPDGRFKVLFDNYGQAAGDMNRLAANRFPVITPLIKPPVAKDNLLWKSLTAREHEMDVQLNVGADMSIKAGNVDLYGEVHLHNPPTSHPTPHPAPTNRRPRAPIGRNERWGGIHAQVGLLRQAKIGRGQLYGWAEPQTGGEAFIPRHGDRARALSILSEAARWHGADLVPRAGAAGASSTPARSAVSVAASGPVVHNQVRVYLGNEELTDRVRVVVQREQGNAARQASWGRRGP